MSGIAANKKIMHMSVNCHAFGNSFIIPCPPKYFKDLQKLKTLEKEPHNTHGDRVCAPLHPSCYTCRGDLANNCTSCPPFSTHDRHWSCSRVDFKGTYSSWLVNREKLETYNQMSFIPQKMVPFLSNSGKITSIPSGKQ
ncbi:hypothetical protein GDO81_001219 [Engystomops pustulosus]|uniref:Uncharacterized protein n=1 Tax=Engystomops pustulosus TaxID=76066 RepID=A0AAV7DCL0_ENGPU|nr:hypothetical protein GDO81_001219 [Engystomops pustulosus]